MASPIRQSKVAERLKDEIGQILLSEMKDPRIGMASVLKVKVSKDLRNATVFVTILGSDQEKKTTMHGLKHGRGFIQTLVSKRLDIRFAPIIKFVLDESIEKSIKVSKLIDEIAAERKAREGIAADATDAGGDEGDEEDDDEEDDDEEDADGEDEDKGADGEDEGERGEDEARE